jgi:hypothetical protein
VPTHRVALGETLTTIAEAHGVPRDAIVAANPDKPRVWLRCILHEDCLADHELGRSCAVERGAAWLFERMTVDETISIPTPDEVAALLVSARQLARPKKCDGAGWCSEETTRDDLFAGGSVTDLDVPMDMRTASVLHPRHGHLT